MPDIVIAGATYPDVPAIETPKSGGGTAKFYDPNEILYAGSATSGGAAELTVAIPYGEVDSTSTNTKYTATVPGIHELKNGVICYIRNDVVTSTTNFTLNVNGLGAKPVYVSNADSTRVSSAYSSATTWLFIYNEDRVSGGCWDAYYGQVNSNTIGYQVRTNSSTKTVTGKCYRYRLLFTSADGSQYVPANESTSTNATASRTTCTTPIDPFGDIRYYGTTTALSANGSPSATILWQQYVVTLGYSFNNTGAALAMTAKKPVYLRCTPQANGSAVMDYWTHTLPSSEDGKIYIFLGVAIDATTMELNLHHPVYYYKDGAIQLWTGKAASASSSVVCTITVTTVGNETHYTSDKTARELNDAMAAGMNIVFRFFVAGEYIYAGLDHLHGRELKFVSYQTQVLSAATMNDYYTLTVSTGGGGND